MKNERTETKTDILASSNILHASPYGEFLSWDASEQEEKSRVLKKIMDKVAAQVNRSPLEFFGVEFTAEVIIHTDEDSVFIALGLVYRADADLECVEQTSSSIKKIIIDAIGVLGIVMSKGKGDAAKITVLEREPNESGSESIVYAEKNVAKLANQMRKVLTRARGHGADIPINVGGNEIKINYRETAVPMVQDLTEESELVTIRNVSDETLTCFVKTKHDRLIELQFLKEERNALCDAQRNSEVVDVIYNPKTIWKSGRRVNAGGVIRSVGPHRQGTLQLQPPALQEKAD